MSWETQQGRISTFRESDLKICELCGHLNLASNTECFVCGWHGHFEHTPEVVRAAVELAVRRYGRLELHYLTDSRTYRQPVPTTPRSRIVNWFKNVWRWLTG